MKNILHASPILLMVTVAACAPAVLPPRETQLPALPRDIHSQATPDVARVTSIALDLTPDFTTRTIRSTARLTIARSRAAHSITLDSRELSIRSVTDTFGRPLNFTLGTADPLLGSALTVELPAESDTIVIEYESAPSAAAVQWLAPEQTSGGQLPFLFTQGQAILTRTWVPTQDSPGIRQSYEAIVRVPEGMRAVMSAEHVGAEGERDSRGLAVYRFRMTNPIPPYLIALAVGDLAFRGIGPKTGVYAEPAIVERAAAEFVEVDEMLAAAERLYGPYRWGRYDILVLPPSFPFGGMENPTLTFATPTILAGDRSLVSLVAHELAHSWSGNLVTNAVWADFWLNEGFTTYLETRIMEELRGKEYADMLRVLGRQDLERTVGELGGPEAPDTRLQLDLTGRNPDDAVTSIAYEKGAAFLETIESVVGRARLDAFLRAYFATFAFQPMTAELLLSHMRQNLLTPAEASRVGLEEWVYRPGIPANAPPVHSSRFAAVGAQVQLWLAGAAPATLDTSGWSTHEWLHFLRALPDSIAPGRVALLDSAFVLSAGGNSEILFEWLRIAIRNRYEPAFPALERFLLSQGRRKYVAPLYADLARTEWGRPMALAIYARARPTYHSVTTNTVDRTLAWRAQPPPA